MTSAPDALGPTEVAEYYDRNTVRFLFVGRSREGYAIHRELWGPGVRNVREASDFVNRLLADEIGRLGHAPAPKILDMGCGVGGTVLRLAEALPDAELVGVTISEVQYRLAERLARKHSLEDRCRFLRDDFQTMRMEYEADVVLAVEAFVHSESPVRFMRSAASRLRAGGHILMADDFLTMPESELGSPSRDRLVAFRRGWKAPSVCTVADCESAADAFGLELVRNTDLSEMLRLGRPRDRLIARLAPYFRRMRLERRPFFANMIGGEALQAGLREGTFRYRMLTFEKPAV